ncbi:unnamed protein product [Effrenium voratum]|uniref:Uncharacterized protein n=1 Tax=Effrenium voratum TaxID=2562239 RepID=A0AA36MGI5_9DINO|nr:unnamed protein product [Effrenium voratum]
MAAVALPIPDKGLRLAGRRLSAAPRGPPQLPGGIPRLLRAVQELLLPLRALNEGRCCMHQTFSRKPLPAEKIDQVVEEITKSAICPCSPMPATRGSW